MGAVILGLAFSLCFVLMCCYYPNCSYYKYRNRVNDIGNVGSQEGGGNTINRQHEQVRQNGDVAETRLTSSNPNQL